ncbi:DHA3 family macrolide efflux protein-like MFS transporter [Neobacillus niacini]|jgi:MFS transporter, DHA3 family, macrolide efflux protein|uniref:MFS transporter n=1 Tax=Neobacillus niacini TaxID=86668 RepID=UPI0027896A1F|nr:MFS transporter [Neobacillus niacini]MDQ1004457.1 DHA3 family macrolide efflux protein-like MFS transporter [Neobacillus niacini]
MEVNNQGTSSSSTGNIFANRIVLAIMSSNFLLQLGIWIRNFAILLYVTDITDNDPVYVSLISVVEFTPIFIFSFIGGTFADRWKPKLTMVWCDMLSAVSIGLVLLALVFGSWQAIFLATLISAILSQFSMPSAMKLLKQHVPGEQLQSVMAMFQSLMAIFMVIGPVIGTLVYQNYGIYISIGVMGAMFLLSGLVLMILPRDLEKEKSEAQNNFKKELADGFRYVMSKKVLKSMGGIFAVCGLAVGLISPLMIFITIEKLGMPKESLQWLLMANGIGMLAGGGIVMAFSKKISPQKLLAIGIFASMVFTVGIGWSTSFVVTLILQVLNGLFFPCIHIGINTIILKYSEEAFIGRVNGVLSPLFMGMMVIGMSVAGVVKIPLTLSGVYTVAGVLFLIGSLLVVPLFKVKEDGAANLSMVEKQPQA